MKALLTGAAILALGATSAMAQQTPQPQPGQQPTTTTGTMASPGEPFHQSAGFGIGPFYGFNLEDSGDDSKSSHLGGLNLSYDHGLNPGLSLSIEQAVFWNFMSQQDGVGGRTAGGLNFNLGGREDILPYIGANIGGVYGRGIADSFFAGPEIGLNLFGFEAKVAYDMPFNRSIDKGIVAATVGLGLRF